MRITIDTELQVIIVPNSYYSQIDKLNVIIEGAGGKKLDYNQFISDCFHNALSHKVIRQSEVVALNPHKSRKKADGGEDRD